ncbi:WCX domain-containing protein [Metabacillus arenae]|uniref:WCX domain-containing protein n=1 Tax=Metabacillus arenae TaxID=2771434 RepID=A0A926NMK5_9BACI|nr:hypothetical protein [Metabacillus arenae]MBD1383398.1 hypothetical protein [Metabacillus arenae]
MWAGKIPAGELPFLSRQLFAFGPVLKVIKPVELQEMVKRRAGVLLGLYE